MMSQRVWTPEQQNAISARDGSLLVSAAAGSGKTAVLVQRVIERLTDEEHPSDADRLLVVTFTNAAAAEMRERIAARLGELLLQRPGDVRLQRQQLLLSRAHISTIHSFCNDLVRENFYKLGISPDFRISDAVEMSLLRQEAMEQVLEELYETGDEFAGFAEFFSSGRDDSRLLRTVETLYDFVRSHPFPEQWLEQKEQMYLIPQPAKDTDWGKTVLRFARSALDYCASLTRNALALIEQDEKLQQAYSPALSADLAGISALQKTAAQGEWDAVCQAVGAFRFERLKALRGYQDHPLKQRAAASRDEVKEVILRLKRLFSFDEAQCREDIANLAPLIHQLFETVRRFSSRLDTLKAERRVADFGDLEHWTLRLLVRAEDGGYVRTPEAEELANNFDEVMVDEYQDTNEAQDMIFRAVSQREQNLFMVGDVKQSIYRFRQAMPEIFLRRKAAYPRYDPQKNDYPACIVLDRNFRSRVGVADAVNFVFRQLMSEETGELDYSGDEELVAGAQYPPRDQADVQLHILDLSGPEGEEADMDEAEADYLADLISRMHQQRYMVTDNGKQRPVAWRDFCILLRNANTHASVYARRLQRMGIPAWCDTAGAFFGTPEVSFVLSLLRVIDNPVQDIPLLAVLMSPVYGFTPSELGEIRLNQGQGPLYFAVRQRAEQGDGRCASFLQEMDEYRRLAATLPSDHLLRELYERTGYLAVAQAMKEGQLRLANLRLLLEYARGYERTGYKGLAGFIRFIDRLQQRQADLAPASTMSETADVVRVMSIHRSKGLEFPVCIVAGCSRQLNKDHGDILLHPALGLGLKLRDDTMMRQYTTMAREAVALEIERGGMSEELRVLYVAMTRAKENLILLTSLKNPRRTLERLGGQLSEDERLSPYVVRSAASYSEWLLSCALRHPDGETLRDLAGLTNSVVLPAQEHWQMILASCEKDQEPDALPQEQLHPLQADEQLLQIFQQRLNYRYPAQALEKIPAKVAASELAARSSAPEYAASARPAFLESDGLTATQRGTALHTFMQFADYQAASVSPEGEVQRLVEQGFLTKEQGEAVDLERVKRFFAGDLAQRMLAAPRLLREYRFTVEIPAKDIDATLPPELQEEPVVLQGAVDCAFEENGGLIVVDYKTDRVADPDKLRQRYAAQVDLYAAALTRCTGLPVHGCYLYSFYQNQALPVTVGQPG